MNFSYITFTDISDYYYMVYLEMKESLLHSVNDGNDISHSVQLLTPSMYLVFVWYDHFFN